MSKARTTTNLRLVGHICGELMHERQSEGNLLLSAHVAGLDNGPQEGGPRQVAARHLEDVQNVDMH